MKNLRSRWFTTIVYPESAHADWLTYLDQVTGTYMVSPLHDKDKLPDGSLKKPHYHVVLGFKSLKSYKQMLEIVKSFGGVGAQIVHDLPAMARYLCHMDSDEPNKTKYPEENVLCQNVSFNELVAREQKTSVKDVLDLIEQKDIVLYYDLVQFALYDPAMLKLVVSRVTFFEKYLKSRGFYLMKPSLSRL